MGFNSEADLFNTALASSALQHLSSLYANSTVLIEPTGLFGIPDLVIASLTLDDKGERTIVAFAFEMKLSNWKRALAQAFKYRAFAEMAFVILDSQYIDRALKQIDRFETANVGLLSTDIDGTVRIHHQPNHDIPFCDHTRASFEKIVSNSLAEEPTSLA